MTRIVSAPTYQLITLTGQTPGDQALGYRHLGHYADLEAALRARVDDVLAQLADNDGWLTTAAHLIIGDGPDGPATVFRHVTELGADPESDRVPDPHNEDGARHWLLAAHRVQS